MSYRYLRSGNPRARKVHQCDFCGADIEIGDRHESHVGSYDGTIQQVRLHDFCSDVLASIRQGWRGGQWNHEDAFSEWIGEKREQWDLVPEFRILDIIEAIEWYVRAGHLGKSQQAMHQLECEIQIYDGWLYSRAELVTKEVDDKAPGKTTFSLRDESVDLFIDGYIEPFVYRHRTPRELGDLVACVIEAQHEKQRREGLR